MRLRNTLYSGFIVILLINVFSVYAAAQSIFSSYGIGELRYFIHTRSIGMGGVGLAIVDPITQNHVNPALMADLSNTSVSGGIRFERLL